MSLPIVLIGEKTKDLTIPSVELSNVCLLYTSNRSHSYPKVFRHFHAKHFNRLQGIYILFSICRRESDFRKANASLIPVSYTHLLIVWYLLFLLAIPAKSNTRKSIYAFFTFGISAVFAVKHTMIMYGCILIAGIVIHKHYLNAVACEQH